MRRVNDGTAAPADEAADGSRRRLFRRYDVGLPATLEWAGGVIACRITDMSLGGAAITPCGMETMGCSVLLRAREAGLDGALAATVVHVDGNRAALRFDLDPPTEDALTFFLMASASTY